MCVPPVTTPQNKRVIQKKRKMWMMVMVRKMLTVMTMMIRYICNLSSYRNDEFARYFLELSLIAPVHRNDSSQRYLDRSSAVFAVLPRPRNNNNASVQFGGKWK